MIETEVIKCKKLAEPKDDMSFVIKAMPFKEIAENRFNNLNAWRTK